MNFLRGAATLLREGAANLAALVAVAFGWLRLAIIYAINAAPAAGSAATTAVRWYASVIVALAAVATVAFGVMMTTGLLGWDVITLAMAGLVSILLFVLTVATIPLGWIIFSKREGDSRRGDHHRRLGARVIGIMLWLAPVTLLVMQYTQGYRVWIMYAAFVLAAGMIIESLLRQSVGVVLPIARVVVIAGVGFALWRMAGGELSAAASSAAGWELPFSPWWLLGAAAVVGLAVAAAKGWVSKGVVYTLLILAVVAFGIMSWRDSQPDPPPALGEIVWRMEYLECADPECTPAKVRLLDSWFCTITTYTPGVWVGLVQHAEPHSRVHHDSYHLTRRAGEIFYTGPSANHGGRTLALKPDNARSPRSWSGEWQDGTRRRGRVDLYAHTRRR